MMLGQLAMGPVRLCKRCLSTLSAGQVIQRLKQRGLIEQSTKIEEHPPPFRSAVYVGFDPTASSLHVGNLVAIMALLHFRREGYQPITVIGGATGLVGDPSGRKTERDKLHRETLEENLAGLSECLNRIFINDRLRSDSNTELKVLNNAEWWGTVSALEFTSDIARHFRLGPMLAKDSVKQRMETEEGMSCTEFLYPIFQAYDFLHLHKHYNCWIQLGGGDQWGNIHAGCNFVKKNTESTVHGVTLPLLTTSAGEKLGKSVNNALWLSPAKTSPYEFYQFFLNTADSDVEKLLRFFTFLSLEEIQNTMAIHQQSPEKFSAQKCLAEHVTQLVHGDQGLQQALNATAALYSKDPNALMKLTEEELGRLFNESLTIEQPICVFNGIPVVELAQMSDESLTKRDVVKLVKHGGLYVNSVRVESADDTLGQKEHLLPGNTTLLRFGKKKYRLVKWK